ncbi:carbon-nitrogen hydrolase family protein [Mycobacterium sp. 1274756.6]|uniref:carbon-nitrogen hydrolase family protein n=1 Tax=Mycobacterium sp. 1274756.6 TaxID=1834076 RepID=UPI0018D406EA|nr:carbon-nitrogen hydrolase family protein [Mycobacterium sp. 1274756.6]
MTRVAAVQLEVVLGDVAANLAACERLGTAAAEAGAEIIVLPEFFTTGIGFLPELRDCALPPDGAATDLLTTLARRHQAIVGGSFLCRDADGHTRNAFLLATPAGIVGRHDKDLPTAWENCFYIGGADDGVLAAVGPAGFTAGAALCWELMRTQTVNRLRGRVDVVLGGSCWSGVPSWMPRRVDRHNAATAAKIAPAFARLVGAPVVHAAHCGDITTRMPTVPLPYRSVFLGGAMIVAADGETLASRTRDQGPGFVLADLAIGRVAPLDEPPERYWLHRRGLFSASAWTYLNWHGRRWYDRNRRSARDTARSA